MCVCVPLYLLHIEYQDINSTSKVKTFLRILAGPQNFRSVCKDLVEVRIGFGYGVSWDG